MSSNAVLRRSAGRTSVPGSRGSPIGTLRVGALEPLDQRRRRSTRARSAGAATCSAGRRCRRRRTRSRAPPGRGRRVGVDDHRVVAAQLEQRAAEARRPPSAPTARPIAVEPVAETSGTRGSSTSASPTSAPPTITSTSAVRGVAEPLAALAGTAPGRRARSAASSPTASRSPGRRRRAPARRSSPDRDREVERGDDADRPQRMPRSPSSGGPGRSEAIVRPYSWRDRPTAKSQMSIISCTSPRPSWPILPASSVTSAPSASFSLAQLVAQQAHQLAAPRRRHVAPDLERLHRPRDRGLRVGLAGRVEVRDHLARDGRAHLEVAAAAGATSRCRGG